MRSRLLFLVIVLPLLVAAQQYNFRNYSVTDGVAQSQVFSLLQDHRGYMWMGTRGGGLTRFDGLTFHTFTEADGLKNSYIHKIREDKQHNLWIATNSGISFYDGRKFVNFDPDPSRQVWVYDISIDDKDRKWLATSVGLMVFENGGFRFVSKELGQSEEIITTVLADSKERIWFGSSQGLFRLVENGNSFKIRKLGNDSRYMKNAITSAREDKHGNIWIGTYGDGAYKYDGKTFCRIDYNRELYKVTVLDITPDDASNIWFATLTGGVIQYNTVAKSFTFIDEQKGLSNNHVRSIVRDNSGSMWFGTSGGGVCHYYGKEFTTFDKSSGMAGNFVYSIYRDSKDRLWTGTSQKGLSMLSSGRFRTFGLAEGFADLKVKAIAEDENGILYFGTDGQGVYRYDGAEFFQIPGLTTTYVRGLVSEGNNIWVATAGHGLFCISTADGTTAILKNYIAADGLLHNRMSCLYKDRFGTIWYGTENSGVGAIVNGTLSQKKITGANGLRSALIRSITEDRAGRLWIGTAGSGIAYVNLKDPELEARCFDHHNGLRSSNVYLLTTDFNNNLIIGTEAGLDLVQLRGLQKLSVLQHYGSGDGFTGIETCQNAVWNDRDGSIWFGTINNLAHYVPAANFRNPFPPVISITAVKLFYQDLSETAYKDLVGSWNTVEPMYMAYADNHLTFDFLGINFSDPKGVSYQWKLAGFDKKWSPVTSEHTITYSNLSPGDYVFLVKSCNEDGVWNTKPVEVEIHIAAPFWYQWWFILLECIAGLLVVYSIFRLQTGKLRRKAKEAQHQLQLQMEIVELEQKALRLQMNPHFIFNALNSIQSLIGTGNEQEARYYLAKFSRLMRQILDNSRNTLITLEEEINSLENYLLVEQFCNRGKFDYSITVDPDLERDIVKLPPMLLQPFVENAVKHGFRFDDASKKGMITILFDDKGDYLECSVSDNGIGRERSAENNVQSMETYHISTALDVTSQRLELLPRLPGVKLMEIIDETTADGEAAGTTVIIRIPLI